jgi:uncharacterized protein YoaH (UPF0181 family)
MPLKRGRSRAVVSGNIRELMHHGHSQGQSIAIAMRTAGISKKGKKVAHKKRKKRKTKKASSSTVRAYKAARRKLIKKYFG